MAITSKLIGENVKFIRKARKLEQVYVAEQAQLSRAAYQKIEKGTMMPRVLTLQRIAKALEVNVSDLFQESRSLSAVRFRSKKVMKSRDAILMEVHRWIQRFNELEEILDDHIPFVFQSVIQRLEREKPASKDRPKVAAKWAREALELSEKDLIVDICGLLEFAGVKVCPLSVSADDFFGLSVSKGDGGPAAVINAWERFPVERWIFSAAHELGHLLLHLNSYDVEKSVEDKREEEEANQFASLFLMPQSAFDDYLKKHRGLGLVDWTLKVKKLFGVSYKTILKRLIDIGKADPRMIWRDFNVLYKIQYGKSLGFKEEPEGVTPDEMSWPSPEDQISKEPQRLTPSDFICDRLRYLVQKGIEEGKITMSRAAEIQGMDLAATKEWAASWRYLNEPRHQERNQLYH